MHGEFHLRVAACMVSLSCKCLLAWGVSVLGATCMVCLSCEWLHAWCVGFVSGCMSGEFESWVAACMVSFSCEWLHAS